jgi:precorrin-8X/cobalt-precorrin-8 methylmutase
MLTYDYKREPAAIYAESFSTIRAEASLSRFPADVEQAVVRMIHACGQVDLADDVAFSPGVVAAARAALRGGAPILCDSNMVASGVTRKRLPAHNDVVCTIDHPLVLGMSLHMFSTRAAASLDIWRDRMQGSVVAIGNAPTALFRLLDMLSNGAPRPAAIVGVPVGFVGAAESKQALEEFGDIEFLTVRGRRGGSAIAAAAINAIASERE